MFFRQKDRETEKNSKMPGSKNGQTFSKIRENTKNHWQWVTVTLQFVPLYVFLIISGWILVELQFYTEYNRCIYLSVKAESSSLSRLSVGKLSQHLLSWSRYSVSSVLPFIALHHHLHFTAAITIQSLPFTYAHIFLPLSEQTTAMWSEVINTTGYLREEE